MTWEAGKSFDLLGRISGALEQTFECCLERDASMRIDRGPLLLERKLRDLRKIALHPIPAISAVAMSICKNCSGRLLALTMR